MIELILQNPNVEYGDSSDENMMSIDAYLKTRPDWTPALEDTALNFHALTESQNSSLNPFGLIDFIIPQLSEIQRRLKNNQFGILRTTGDWRPALFIFEPKDSTTYFSALGILPEPYLSYYPLAESPVFFSDDISQQNELYNYISSNRKSIVHDDSVPELQNIEFDTSELISSLGEQAKLGNELLKYLRAQICE